MNDAVSASDALVAALSLTGSGPTGSPAPAQDAPASMPRETAPPATSQVVVIPFELADNLVRISVDLNGQRRSGVRPEITGRATSSNADT